MIENLPFPRVFQVMFHLKIETYGLDRESPERSGSMASDLR